MKRRANDSGAGQQEQPPSYKIYVKMMKTVALDVKSTDTVDQIKSKIGAIEGLDKSHQALFFAGSHLENNKSLDDYNIMTYSSVDLYITDGMQLYVKIPSVGKVISLHVKKSQIVSDVKAAIEEKGGIPLDEQILMHAGRQLEDDKSLSQCGLSNGQTLLVWTEPSAVEALEGSDSETLQDETEEAGGAVALEDSETLQDEAETCGSEAPEDSETLQNLNIRNNDVLNLYQNFDFQVFVKAYEGRTLALFVRATDTADEVLKKVEEKLHLKSDIYYLLYRGCVLSRKDTLQQHYVGRNATIHVRLRNSHVPQHDNKKH